VSRLRVVNAATKILASTTTKALILREALSQHQPPQEMALWLQPQCDLQSEKTLVVLTGVCRLRFDHVGFPLPAI